MITDDEVSDTAADLFDDTGTFVAENHRQRPRSIAINDREVGVAESSRFHLDEHFTRAGRCEIDIGDFEWSGFGIGRGCTRSNENGSASFHISTLRCSRWCWQLSGQRATMQWS
jgi:hypothetical protein